MSPGDQLTALRDAVAALETAGVRCALIGGTAVGARSGVPRATLDVDLAVPTSYSRPSVVDALVGAGFELRGEHAHSVNFRHPNGEAVQLAFDPAFDQIVERARPVGIEGTHVAVAIVEDLIAMKERAARDPAQRRSKALRHLADVELLRGDIADDDEGW